MNTIQIEKKNCKLIAHRGCSGLERENTCPAFVAAGVKTYYGIETDVHVTKDGKFLICHDDNLVRTSGVDMVIEENNLSDLRAVPVLDSDGVTKRSDLVFPIPEDYLNICKKYGKYAVLELKNRLPDEKIVALYKLCETLGVLDLMIFISFNRENLTVLRSLSPTVRIQYLVYEFEADTLDFALKRRFDLDAFHGNLTAEHIKTMHAAGLQVNCWTVDDPQIAHKMIEMGVDYITTNILE